MTAVDEFEMGAEQTRPPPRRRAGRGRPVPWVIAALALVLVGTAIVPSGGLPATGFRPDAIGVLDVDLSQPPEEQWRVPVDGWEGPQSITLTGSVTVVYTGTEALGISTDTGEVLWHAPVNAALCTIHESLVCLSGVGGDATSLVRIDPTSGEQTTLEIPRTMAATDVGGDLLTLTQDSGEWFLQRITTAGVRRWAIALDQSNPTSSGYDTITQLTVIGKKAYLIFQGTGLVVDVGTGAALGETVTSVSRTTYGYLLRGDDWREVPILLSHAGTLITDHLTVIPDDDPGSSIRVERAESHLVVRADGRDLWPLDSGEIPIARVDGVLVTASPTSSSLTLTGRDLTTGAVLWTDSEGGGSIAASGSTLLTSSSAALTAIDVHTGSELWSYGDTVAINAAPTSDGLILHLGDELVRLVWPR